MTEMKSFGSKIKWESFPLLTKVYNQPVSYELRYLAAQIKRWEDDYGLQLNPDFQRGHMWTSWQRIEYLEFFFGGGNSGRILYFNMPSWGGNPAGKDGYDDFVCVDGLQRLTAILGFLDEKIPVFGYYRSQLDSRFPTYANSIEIVINTLQSKAEVLRWYLEMNSQGVPHTQAELDLVKLLLLKER